MPDVTTANPDIATPELMKSISDSTLDLGDIAVGSNYHIQALDWEKLNKLFATQPGR